MGFPVAKIQRVRAMVAGSQFKRILPPVAQLELRRSDPADPNSPLRPGTPSGD
jgi:hypothetical protein